MNLFKNFIYYVLSLQEKMITKSLSKTLGVKNNSRRKKFFSKGCLLSLDSVAETERIKMEEELLLILKTAGFDPNNILNYIKMHGTDIFYIENEKTLNAIGENAGFIYPQKGLSALALSLLTKQGCKLETKEMFVLTKGELNTYYFVYNFYNWYVYKKGISGIDREAQELLNKYLYNSSNDEIAKLQLGEIYKLKDAIKQDKLAIEFVFKLCQKFETSKKALEKIKNAGAQI